MSSAARSSGSVEREIATALQRRDLHAAARAGLEAHGPSLLRFLVGVLRSEDDAREAYAQLCEDLWRALPGFRGEGSFRAWAHRIAWHAALRLRREGYRRRGRRLRTTEASRLAAPALTSGTLERRHADLDRVRSALEPEERALLILRLDQGLPWDEVARVLSTAGDQVTAAAARKRFQRASERIAGLARAAGLLDDEDR